MTDINAPSPDDLKDGLEQKPPGDASGVLGEPAAAELSPMMKVFIGPNGIRAGWRLLVFIVIAGILIAGLTEIARLLVSRSAHGLSPGLAVLNQGLILFSVLLAAAVMGRIERRPFAQYGLPRLGAFGRMFWQGALWGFLALTALLVAIRALHGFSFGGLALHGSALAADAALWALFFLLVGLFEEFLTRGYALFTLSTGMGFWPSAFLLSAVFGALHLGNRGESWIGGLSAALIGLFFCLTLRRTGSLWFAIGLHAMWDYSESFIYSVPDSGALLPGHLLNSSFHGPAWLTGGTVGPEGSGLVFIVIAALFVIFNRLHREAQFPFPRLQPGTVSES